jgi:membrane protease YdiL (CAAX protease family)
MTNRWTIGYKPLLFVCLSWLLVCDVWLFKTNGWVRLGLSVVAYGGLGAIFWLSGLKFKDIGLAKSHLKAGVLLALKLTIIYSLFLLVIFLIDRSLFKDSRYHHPIGTALYAVLLILPAKTILFEELAFRGIVPALINKVSNVKSAILYSSLIFGAWHLTTALGVKSDFTSHGFRIPSVVVLLIIFVITSVAGYILCYLRYKSDSLVTPLILHWFINASAVILAAISWTV